MLFNANRNVEMANELTKEELIAHVQKLTENQESLFDILARLQNRAEDPFLAYNTPDPIKILSPFSGNKKETQAWIEDVEDTLSLFDKHKHTPTYNQIIRAVKSKITGNAKEILIAAGNPSTWDEIKEVLLNAYGDRRDLASHFQSLFYISQGNKTITEYYNITKGIDTAIKSTAAVMDDYKSSTKAINKLIGLMTLTRFIDGLGEKLSMHVRSYRPESLEEAYHITMQYSNAAYRQKLEQKPSVQPQHFSKRTSNYNAQSHSSKPNHNNTNSNQSQNQSGSGYFKNHSAKQPTDGDVSMRTARSKMQLNAHINGKRNDAKEHELDEQESDTQPVDDSALDSDDDEFFLGEELNFLGARNLDPNE